MNGFRLASLLVILTALGLGCESDAGERPGETGPERIENSAEPSREAPSLESVTKAAKRRSDTLAAGFQKESVDPEWAGAAEAALSAGLARPVLEGLEQMRVGQDLRVQSVECRSTQCLLDLAFTNADARDRIAPLLPFLMPWDGRMSFVNDPQDQRRVWVYVSPVRKEISTEPTSR